MRKLHSQFVYILVFGAVGQLSATILAGYSNSRQRVYLDLGTLGDDLRRQER